MSGERIPPRTLSDTTEVGVKLERAKGQRVREKGTRNYMWWKTDRKTELQTEKSRGEWKKENHLTPLFSRGQGGCKLDIKTQIAFRQVTLCHKILDACREETTIPISLWENNIFIFRPFIEWKLWGIRFYGVWAGSLQFLTPMQQKGRNHSCVLSLCSWISFSQLEKRLRVSLGESILPPSLFTIRNDAAPHALCVYMKLKIKKKKIFY